MERQPAPSQPIPINQKNIALRHIENCDCCYNDLHLQHLRCYFKIQQKQEHSFYKPLQKN